MVNDIRLPGDFRKDYTYQAFGLHIWSCLPCPELLPSSQPPDVTITYGRVPEGLTEPLSQGCYYQKTPGLFLLKVTNIASYLVKNGKEIIIERAPQANDIDVRLFLLGTVMGALMHQRGGMPLHGSAIRLPDGTAASFMGPKGVGKSTLAAAFRQRGYVVAADDVSLIMIGDDGSPWLQPAYPELKLWAEAVAKIGEDAQTLPRARTKLEKYSLCFHNQFDASPLLVRRLYFLETSEMEQIEIIRLKGLEKIAVLDQNTYRRFFLDGLEQKKAHFKLCAALGRQTQVSRVRRPENTFGLDQLVDMLERDFG